MFNLEKTFKKQKKGINLEILRLNKEILEVKLSEKIILNESQKKDYESCRDNENPDFKFYKNEKDYLIKNKEMQIDFLKNQKISLICKKKGHQEKILSFSNHSGAFVECERCEIFYNRPMNYSESKIWSGLVSDQFTI